MKVTLTNRRRRLRILAAASAASLALVAAIAAGAAQASPPLKNAEHRCVNAGGTFSMTTNEYDCTGLSSNAAMDSARKQCTNAYKGVVFNFWMDVGTGLWQYSCMLSF